MMQVILLSILLLSIYFQCFTSFTLSRATNKLNINSKQQSSFDNYSSRKYNTKYNIKYSQTALFDTNNQLSQEITDQPTGLAAWFSLNTRGGAITWSVILTIIPTAVYFYLVSAGYEDTKVGAYVGAIFVLLTNLLWASTYIFRVATKDMTYAQQLRDYENAVLQKRLDELADYEIQALMEEIDVEEAKKDPVPF